MKRVVILGSTGSVGGMPAGLRRLCVIVCRWSASPRKPMRRRWRSRRKSSAVPMPALRSRRCGISFPPLCPGHCRALAGLDGILEMVRADNVDMVLCSIVGTGGLIPVMEALRAGREIALASKEVLVMAGSVVMPMVKRYHTRLIPVDSEHSAIYQCLGSRAACKCGAFDSYRERRVRSARRRRRR